LFDLYTIGQLDSWTVSVTIIGTHMTIIGTGVTITGNRLSSLVIFGARLNVHRADWQSVFHSGHLGCRPHGLTSLLAYVIALDILLRKAQGISCILLAGYARECK
jgi:hypothetical protein